MTKLNQSAASVARLNESLPLPSLTGEERPATEEIKSLKRIGNVFVKTCLRWGLGNSERNILLGLKDSSDELADVLLSGALPMRDANARIGCVIRIGLGLQILFSSDMRAETAWMNAKRHSLRGLAPIDYMLQGELHDVFRVEELVNRDQGL